jgi:hypothetical protein
VRGGDCQNVEQRNYPDRIELSCSVCGDRQVLRPQPLTGVIG